MVYRSFSIEFAHFPYFYVGFHQVRTKQKWKIGGKIFAMGDMVV